MRDLFRRRVRQAAAAALDQPSGSAALFHDPAPAERGPRLSPAETNRLLTLPPHLLSLDELVLLVDQIDAAGLTANHAEQIASAARDPGAFPLPAVADDSEAAILEGKETAMRFALWAGYIAAPALARVGPYARAIELLDYLSRRLADADYANVEGAGSQRNPEMRMLILAPAIAGLTEHYPTAPRGEEQGSIHASLTRFFRMMPELGPVTECVRLRIACLGIVARHSGVQPFLAAAKAVAIDRHEKEFVTVISLFDDARRLAERPELFATVVA